jgi:hypothetical protein
VVPVGLFQYLVLHLLPANTYTNMKLVHKLPIFIILLLTLLFANLRANKRDGGHGYCLNICGDARGYYAWLPAIFIYHDLNFHFFDSVEKRDSTCGVNIQANIQDYRHIFEGIDCDKYYPGASLMMLPFFAIAHFTTLHATAYPANGYTLLYFKVMPFCCDFYFLLGMLFFLMILDKLKCTTLQKCLTIIFLIFGSNIVFYIVDAPLYSHVYSFALISAFLYYAFCLKENYKVLYIALICFLAGWIMIARPVNICIVFMLPFILGSRLPVIWRETLLKPIRLSALLCGLIMPVILLMLYKVSTGHYFIYSYGPEVFNFKHPHLLHYLFSYDNGVLPYTPLFFTPLLLLFAWYRPEYKNMIAGTLLTLAAMVYVNSSWWCWWYGTSFGARSILDFLPLFGILIALSLQVKPRRYLYILPVYLLCCGLTMLLYHENSACHYMGLYPVTDYWKAVNDGLGIK